MSIFVARHVGAGEVHARLEADVGVDGLYERSGEVGGATACVQVMSTNWAEIGHALDTVIEVGEPWAVRGGKYSKLHQMRLPFRLCDLVGDLPGGVALGRREGVSMPLAMVSGGDGWRGVKEYSRSEATSSWRMKRAYELRTVTRTLERL